MARKPMVSRTIITTKAIALCLDTVSCEAMNKVAILPRTYADPKKLLNAVRAQLETEDLKVAKVVDVEEVETLYGMTEEDFIANAVILDPTTRKPIDNDNAESEDNE